MKHADDLSSPIDLCESILVNKTFNTFKRKIIKMARAGVEKAMLSWCYKQLHDT